jgi:mRNA interferase RelE/StbE
MYRVVLSPAAEKVYRSADRPLARKLAKCFEQLESQPRHHPNIKPLKGRFLGYFRYRVGDRRVIYRIEETGRLVIVAIIAHRKDVYD